MDKQTQQCIANNLRYLRSYCDYTQSDIAKLLHISTNSYRMIESGARHARTDTLMKLAQIYQIPVDLLFEEDHETFAREVILARNADVTELINLYRRLSPFSQGCLLENASVLLMEEKIKENS